jgi:hypothetical protein
LLALLTKETDPDAGPLTPGTKLTTTVLVAPAASDNGSVKPGALYTPPVKLAAVTVTEPPPVFVSVTFWLEVLPTRTLPNEMLVGDADNSCVPATVTVAEADFDLSATLVAVTV